MNQENSEIISVNETKKRAKRSSGYPVITLEDSIQMVKEARAFGRDVDDAQLAGQGSINSGQFRRKKASLRYFSLIEGREKQTRISDLAENILNPLSETEKLTALKKSFLSPAIYKTIYEKVQKQAPIKVDFLGNLVVRNHGIPINYKKQFLNILIKSGTYAGLISYTSENTQDEIIFKEYSDEETNLKDENKEQGLTTPIETIEEDKNFLNKDNTFVNNIDTQSVEITLSKGIARIIVPKIITEKDVKKLIAQINVLALNIDE